MNRSTRPLSKTEVDELAARASALGPDVQAILRAPTTEIARVDTPFFPHASVFRVEHWLRPTRTLVLTLGSLQDGTTLLLPTNPEAWMRLAASGVDLGTESLRLAYAISFLETTRSFAERFQVLHEVDQLEPRPGMSDEDGAVFEDIRQRFASSVPPTITATAPWKASIFAVKGQDLVRYLVRIAPTGQIEATPSVVERELPIVWAL